MYFFYANIITYYFVQQRVQRAALKNKIDEHKLAIGSIRVCNHVAYTD